ncbi:SDR family oxidoreductase [Hydrocarboniclastica marina]|uniref:Short chain dehydrogenase n=1 Tax=Hydrocarboniclastica marina TaxID=2259620 RepID=A0A4P7XEA3_9ALTE|nr:SDR family oxidoreductase [Hydrocarboniclastica marina]QCF25208.1 short chain dehydrogenase [Hydrocarboniclastica marina]
MHKRELEGKVVVITGASSGIGRATAEAFAAEGACLALAARDADALAEVAAACSMAGGKAMVVPTDVTNAAAVAYLAEQALLTYGGKLDIWVNNAGVGAVGGYCETPMAVHDQVIRTNLLGYMHGAHTALPIFKRQGQGMLINNISFGAWMPAPYAAAYSASKYGLAGFSDALKGELRSWPHIHICDVFPSFINTPGLETHGANYSGHAVKSTPWAADPFKVARAIVGLAKKPQEKMPVGALSTMARIAHSTAPRLGRNAAARTMESLLSRANESPASDGALFQSIPASKGVYGERPRLYHNRTLLAGAMAVALGYVTSRLMRRSLQ